MTRLALYQAPPTDGDVEAAFARIAAALKAAAAAGAAMVVFPELMLPGYNRPDLHATLAQPQGGEWCRRLAALARAAGCGLTIGWAERKGEAVYNAATAFDASGEVLAHYRKIQLFGEMEAGSFRPGNRYCRFELDGRPAALMICYDVEFAAHVRALAEDGAGLILVPTANAAGFEHVQRVIVPARAAELGLVVAYANYAGTEAGLDFPGLSVIAGPDGQPLAMAGRGEALLVVDLAAADAMPAALRSTQLRDFRRVE